MGQPRLEPKLGGKENLRVVVKGGADLTQSLFPVNNGGGIVRKGLNELVHEKYEGAFNVEMIHEPSGLAGMALQQLELAGIPMELQGQGMDDFLRPQFETCLTQESFDVLVLSVGEEILQELWQHKTEGYIVSPPVGWEGNWTEEQKSWLQEHFSPATSAFAKAYQENIGRLIEIAKERLDLHVIIFNSSTVVPDDRVHNYFGLGETTALRAHKCNLSLLEMSMQQGTSIIDVDRLIAEIGGTDHVTGPVQYSARANDKIRDEFLRVLEDVGFFERRPLVMQVGAKELVR